MKTIVAATSLFCILVIALCQIIRNQIFHPHSDSRERRSPIILFIAVLAMFSDIMASGCVRICPLFLILLPAVIYLWLLTSSMWETMNLRHWIGGALMAEVIIALYNVGRIIWPVPEPGETILSILTSMMVLLLTGLLIYGFVARLLHVKTIMKLGTVWMIVCLVVDVVYVLAVIFASALCQIGAGVFGLIVLTGIIVSLALRIMTDSEFLIWKKQERIIVESMKVTSVTSAVDGSRIDEVYKDLYERIMSLFDTEKPYLNNNLTINDIVRRLYSNKLYISRAISQYTGRNFCQFVNYYRVMHSIDSFRENPELKIHELATMSGFNSMVSYNMAFRLFMGENPSEWCRKEKSNLIKKIKLVVESTK